MWDSPANTELQVALPEWKTSGKKLTRLAAQKQNAPATYWCKRVDKYCTTMAVVYKSADKLRIVRYNTQGL